MSETPLLPEFHRLARLYPHLGTGDYLVAVDALLSLGLTSRQDLLTIVSALWGRSRLESAEIARLLAGMLADRVDAVGLPARQEPRPPSTDATGNELANTTGAATPAGPATGDGTLAQDVGQIAGRRGGSGTSTSTVAGEHAERVAVALGNLPQGDLPKPHEFDLVGEEPRLQRAFVRALSYQRPPTKRPSSGQTDVDATVDRMARTAILERVECLPVRDPVARLEWVEDVSADMAPFAWITRAARQALEQAQFGLERASYVDTSAGAELHATPSLGRARPPGSPCTAAMVVSEGGSARGIEHRRRIDRMISMLDALRRGGPVVWLNPVPAERWAGSDAAVACEATGTVMFELSPVGLRSMLGHHVLTR